MEDFWDNFQEFINHSVPKEIIEILVASGYDNSISVAGICEEEIQTIEKYANEQLKHLINFGQYSDCERFVFLPGHRKLLIKLALKAKEFEMKQMKTKDTFNLSNATLIMKELINSMKVNANVPKNSHRYSEILKSFATYIYILSGKAAYEVLCNNLPLPQSSTIMKYIHEKQHKIVEGELRCKELAEYLDKLNAPKEVHLEEDGSGIVAKCCYDSSTNQLVGLVLPTNARNGMPVTYSFTPQSMTEIKQQIEQNEKSTLVYLILAQPIMDNVPPFILQIYGINNTFKSGSVVQRWQHTKDQLATHGIKVTSISADGDARLLTSMKHAYNSMIGQLSSDVLSNLSREQLTSFIQDIYHVATKLRNRLQKPSILLPMGSKQVSVTHLKILISTIPKEIHGLVGTDICPEDRQNYASFEKITQDRVLKALELYIMDSEATVQYLRLSRNLTKAFTDENMEPMERVKLLWHALYFFRAWRKWIQKNDNYDAEKNFISTNAFSCIELNAYGMLHLITKFRDSGQNHLFLPQMFNSQHCESTFRQFRSMTTANWTRINFTMLELLNMINRIEMQNEIAFFKLSDIALLPRLHKRTERNVVYDLPTKEQLHDVMSQSLKSALCDTAKFGMNISVEEICSCELTKGHLWNQQVPKHSEEVCSEVFEDAMDCTYFRDYSGKISKIDGNSAFVEVIDKDGIKRIIRKGSIVWKETQPRQKLSNDRLRRVQGQKGDESPKSRSRKRKVVSLETLTAKKKLTDCSNDRDLFILDEIRIGDWCVFRKIGCTPSTNSEKYNEDIIIGSVLGFKYSVGSTEKDKQYSLDIAPTTAPLSNKRGIEVLALWYDLTKDLVLQPLLRPSFFVNIDNYVTHTKPLKCIQNSITGEKSYKISENPENTIKSLLDLLS